MKTIKIKDKEFIPMISEAEIKERVKLVAEQISNDMKGKNPLLLAVLNGSFVFAADLMREITIPSEISLVVIGINEDLTGRTVIIVEDIVESGLTIKQMIESIGTRNPESVHICTLLLKPECLKTELDIEYAAFKIPNDFIVGYGLDYDQQGRNLKDIYVVKGRE